MPTITDWIMVGITAVPDEPDSMGDYPIDGWEAVDLLERLGYDISFEGEIWKLETNGVYYLK